MSVWVLARSYNIGSGGPLLPTETFHLTKWIESIALNLINTAEHISLIASLLLNIYLLLNDLLFPKELFKEYVTLEGEDGAIDNRVFSRYNKIEKLKWYKGLSVDITRLGVVAPPQKLFPNWT